MCRSPGGTPQVSMHAHATQLARGRAEKPGHEQAPPEVPDPEHPHDCPRATRRSKSCGGARRPCARPSRTNGTSRAWCTASSTPSRTKSASTRPPCAATSRGCTRSSRASARASRARRSRRTSSSRRRWGSTTAASARRGAWAACSSSQSDNQGVIALSPLFPGPNSDFFRYTMVLAERPPPPRCAAAAGARDAPEAHEHMRAGDVIRLWGAGQGHGNRWGV
jgi:hypothetical protein